MKRIVKITQKKPTAKRVYRKHNERFTPKQKNEREHTEATTQKWRGAQTHGDKEKKENSIRG